MFDSQKELSEREKLIRRIKLYGEALREIDETSANENQKRIEKGKFKKYQSQLEHDVQHLLAAEQGKATNQAGHEQLERWSEQLTVLFGAFEAEENLKWVTEKFHETESSLHVPILEKPISWIEKIFSGIGVIADVIPPLRVMLSGFIWLWESYRAYRTWADHSETKIAKITKVVTPVIGFALALTMLFTPIATTLILGAVGILVGIVRESVLLYFSRKNLNAAQVKLTEMEKELEGLEPNALARKKFLSNEIHYQTQRVEKLAADYKTKRNDIVLATLSLVGAVMLIFPPTTILGAGILLSTVGFGALRAVGNWIANIFSSKTKSETHSSDANIFRKIPPNSQHANTERPSPTAVLPQPVTSTNRHSLMSHTTKVDDHHGEGEGEGVKDSIAGPRSHH